MTELLSDIDAPSDAELISRVRGGDVAAYGELFARHKDAAHRLGRQLVRGPDSDDLVAEAFAKVLQVLQGGGGPDVAFRAYLLTAVRRLHVDRVRAGSRLQTSDDMSQFDPGIPFQDTAVASFESGAAAKAFASLPERWQLVLWHLEVEGQKPADIAPLLGMSANSVSALAYRAREGLRQAFLTMHLADIAAEECRWVTEHLGGYVRKGLSRRDVTKVEGHLEDCRRCTAMYLELSDVNSNLAGIIAPLLLGAAAAGYAASSGSAGITGVLVALSGRVRDVFVANTAAATAATVAAGVATVATAGFVIANVVKDDAAVVAQPPVPTATVGTPNAAVPPRLPLGSASPSTSSSPSAAPSIPGTPSASPSATTSTLLSDAPATIPAFAPSTAPADAPPIIDPAPGGDSGSGTNPGANTDPAAQPTPPSPSQLPPTPSAPVPTQPAPSQPAPTNPAPTSPAPTSPAPSSPAPTTPSPTTTTPPPPTTPADPPLADSFKVGPVTLGADGATVAVPLVNLPEDLVSLKIELDSQETTLADHLPLDTATATCSVGPRQAECTFRTGVSRLARAASLADGVRDLAATLVLDYVPGGRPDELHLTVTGTHSGGAAVTDAVNYRFTPPATAKHNYALTSLTAARHDLVAVDGSPERVDEFHLATTVAELPRHVISARFTISGDASLEDVTSTQAICAVTSSTDFICDNPGSEFGMDVAVRTDGLTKRTVTLGVEIPDSYVDDREDDNRRSLTLVPFPDPAIGALGLTGSAGSTFQVLGDVSLAGVGSPAIFHVTAPANTSIIADGCTPSTPKTDDEGRHVDLTCESSSDDFRLALDVVLPNNDPGDLTVELAVPDEVTDRDVSNNEKSILLRPAATLPADVKIDAAVVQDVRGANIDVAVDLDLGALTAPVDHLFVRVEGEFVRLESATTAAASCGPASDNSFSCPASGLSGEARMMLHLHLEPGHAPDGETVKIYVSPFEHDSGRPFELHVTPGTVEQEGTATRP